MKLAHNRVKSISGSGTIETGPPSVGAVNEASMVSVTGGLPTVIDVGLRVPLSIASTGWGLVPPTANGMPSSDSPSALNEKSPKSSVWVVPSENCTVKLRLLNCTVVVTGKSGGELTPASEFGPV